MIEDIQKVRFLNNLYKSYYSYGKELDETTIKRLYSIYFRENPAGSPLSLDVEILRSTSIANIDFINNMMARALFNMDVLYDATYESIEDLYSIVTSLNNRINSLRMKRTSLEKKIDDYIFSITNSDGYYASFSEEFTDITGIDTKYSSVYLDTDSKSISLSSISSGSFNQIANNTSKSNNIKYSIFFNGNSIKSNIDIGENSSLIFDGLSDTYWKYTHVSNSPGVCSARLDITPYSSSSISKIYGRISSDKKVNIMLQVNSNFEIGNEAPVYSAQSENDFDNFVFQFEPVNLSSASLYLIKNEPDRLVKSGNSISYEYDFIVRDIVLSGLYYDLNGVYVSNPINISYENNKNIIDKVAIDIVAQNHGSNDLQYFIAKDNPSASSIDDFQWIPISPSNEINKSYPKNISFNGSNLIYKTISENQNNSNEILKYFSNIEETKLPGFENVSIYRIAKLSKDINPIEPVILEGYNRFVWHKYQYEENLCVNIPRWKDDVLTDMKSSVVTSSSQVGNTSSFWTAPSIDDGGSVYISFDILMASNLDVQKIITKDDDYSANWDMAIYLNGSLIKRIKPGVSQDNVLWNFKEGINNVIICIDAKPKTTSVSKLGLYGSFTLMQQSRISEYGLIYQKYLSYIAPEIFKNNNGIVNDSFSIATIDTEKYIISNRNILYESRFYYYVNNTESIVDAVRVRINMKRNQFNSKSSPIVTSYRVKFGRSEKLSETVSLMPSAVLNPGS